MKNFFLLASFAMVTLLGNKLSTSKTQAPEFVGPEPYIGEITLFAGNFAPRGWMFCDGQVLPISSNQALFSILGTTYGGDGRTTFSLPYLRGRTPINAGSGPGLSSYRIGDKGGMEMVTLTTAQMPAHTHGLSANTGYGNTPNPDGAVSAKTTSPAYKTGASNTTMNNAAIGYEGGGQAHENRPPYLAVHYIIAVEGIYPSRS